MFNFIFRFGHQNNGEKILEVKRAQNVAGVTKNVCSVVEVDAFLLAYAREKYGPKKEKTDNVVEPL